MQAALSASQAAAVGGKVNQIYIPTPETVQSSIQYDRLYPRAFAKPATYIRFSSTVEDCIGCPYDMDDEDDLFLKSFNREKNASTQCSEDCFEEVMNFFEDTTQAKQPFAAVDSPPVLTFGDMEASFDENISEHARMFAKEIYQHWKRRRLEIGNRALTTGLKVDHRSGSFHSLTHAFLVRNWDRNRRCRSVYLFQAARGSASSQDSRERCSKCREIEKAQERARRSKADPDSSETKRNSKERAISC